MMPNEYTVTIKLKRGQLVRILILLAAHIGTLRFKQGITEDKCVSTYERIHDELREQLDRFDEATAKRKENVK